jgi:antitoxin component YwqK of YwqJK toxin-antitoxin module
MAQHSVLDKEARFSPQEKAGVSGASMGAGMRETATQTGRSDVADAGVSTDGTAAAGSLAGTEPQWVQAGDEKGQVRCQLHEGRLHGVMERLSPGGLPLMRAHFQDGQLHGLSQVFDDSGALVQTCSYWLGQPHGTMKVFVGGRCVSQQQFLHGQLHGPSESFDLGGRLAARLHFVAGQLEGPAAFFHETRLVRQANYKAGLLEGESRDFDAEGAMVQSCTYRAHVLQGPLRRYWPGGELMEEVHYREGVPVAAPVRFNAQGHAVNEGGAPPSLMNRLHRLVRGD